MRTTISRATSIGLALVVAVVTTCVASAQNIYVSNSLSGVSILNPGGAVIASIPVGGSPGGLAFAQTGHLYVAELTGNQVAVVDTVSKTVIATIPVGLSPLCVAVTPNGQFAYVVNSGSSSVSVINTASNTVVATVQVHSTPTSLAISPDGSRVYVTKLFT